VASEARHPAPFGTFQLLGPAFVGFNDRLGGPANVTEVPGRLLPMFSVAQLTTPSGGDYAPFVT